MPVLFIHSPARKTPIWQWQGCPERSRCSWRFCLTRAEMSGETTKARANERRNWVGFTHPAPFQQKPPAMQARRKDIVFFALRFSLMGSCVKKCRLCNMIKEQTNKQTNKQNKLWRWSGTRLFPIGVCQDSFPFYSKTDIIWWSTTKALLSPGSWTPFLCKSFGKNYFIDPYRDRRYVVAYQGFRMRLSIKL